VNPAATGCNYRWHIAGASAFRILPGEQRLDLQPIADKNQLSVLGHTID
jgi:hypothetical protein